MITLRRTYGECTVASTKGSSDQFIAQSEVDPLLVNADYTLKDKAAGIHRGRGLRKFDFRAFLVIVRANPMVALYFPGMLRIAPIDNTPRNDVWKAQVGHSAVHLSHSAAAALLQDESSESCGLH